MKNKTLYLIIVFFSIFIAKAQVNLANWSLTIPEGTTTKFDYPALLNYNTDPIMQKYMFDDPKDNSLVFYALPPIKSQKNNTTTELREVNTNGTDLFWNFSQGATLKVVGRMGEISKENGLNPRVIFIQISSKLDNEQVEKIGSNNDKGPSILKIYWDNGVIKIKTRVLKSSSITGNEILKMSNWTDDDGFAFNEKVGFKKFTIEIKITNAAMEVVLNNKENKVYSGKNIANYGLFGNYFTFGCNLQSDQLSAFANMKYYSVDVSHKK